MKLVFATNNNHKLEEIRSMLPESYELNSLKDIGCLEDPPETQDTLDGNACQKALYVYAKYGVPCFADDSGLEVDALGGRPGVFSARYAGPDKDSTKNMKRLLQELEGITNRKARFVTVIALVNGTKPVLFRGTITGEILNAPMGKEGFGYDPVFKPDGYPVSFASMSLTDKNKISHRARAFALLINYLKS